MVTGWRTPLVQGLQSPSGLAFDPAARTVYVSDTGGGRVLRVDLAMAAPSPFLVATGLASPEGVAVDEDGTVLIVEGDTGRLHRVDPGSGRRQVVASGLATKTVGIGLPLLNYSADVLVRRDGTIVISGATNGSLVEFRRR